MEYLDTKYFSYANPEDSFSRKAFIRSIEFFSGQPKLYKLYRDYQINSGQWDNFWDGCVDKLKLDVTFDQNKINNVPKEGPLIIVANHPFGVLDGLVICWLSKKIRKEFKVLTHSLLLRAPETKGYLLPVDFSGTKEALKTNIETRKTAPSQSTCPFTWTERPRIKKNTATNIGKDIGILSQNTHLHESNSVIPPPHTGPSKAPISEDAAINPNPKVRCFVGNIPTTIAIAAGTTAPPPIACITRANSAVSRLEHKATKALPAMNITSANA